MIKNWMVVGLPLSSIPEKVGDVTFAGATCCCFVGCLETSVKEYGRLDRARIGIRKTDVDFESLRAASLLRHLELDAAPPLTPVYNQVRLHGGIGTERGLRACLLRYERPGNVRELANAVERALVLGEGGLIRPEDLPEIVLESAPPQSRSPEEIGR